MIRKARPLLLVLALSSLGCARGDFTTETLTLVDVTGTWEGPFRVASFERAERWVLQQKGGKVWGEVQGSDGTPIGSIEGLVNGEMFSWRLTGRVLVTTGMGYTSTGSYEGKTPVINDEMSGPVNGPSCGCTIRLRRVNTEADTEKKAQ